jgi:hypothetical protein
MATGEDIVEVQTYTAAVHVPKTGELVEASTLKIPLQALANRTNQIHNSVEVYRGAIGVVYFPFVSADYSLSAQWRCEGNWTQALVSGGNRPILAPIYLPRGSIITRVRAEVLGLGHGGLLPDVVPLMELMRVGPATTTTMFSVSDASPDAANYDSPHEVDSGVISVDTSDPTHAYIVRLYGEYSTNAVVNGFKAFNLRVNFTPIA